MTEPTLACLVALETEVWRALAAGDEARDASLLSDGFLGVYPSGFASRQDHRDQLRGGPTVARFEILDARVRILGPATAMLAYRAVWQRLRGGQPAPPETMYVTSIWAHETGRWTNIFSQDTPAATQAAEHHP